MNMITKMNNLFEKVIVNNSFRKQDLNALGFSDEEINNLCEQNILFCLNGEYNFIDCDRLYAFGNYYFDHNQEEKAYACFKTCYEINRYHIKTCLKLFIYAIKSKKYDEAIEYYSFFSKTTNAKYQKDNNMYLILLSMITKLPIEYYHKLKRITLDDVSVDMTDKRFKNVDVENNSRRLAFYQRFVQAQITHRENETEENKRSTYNLIMRELLNKAYEVEQSNLNKIKDMIMNHDYEGIVSLIKEISFQHHLNKYLNLINFLAKRYLLIYNEGSIPALEDIKVETFDDALWANDYRKARYLIIKRNKERGHSEVNDLAFLILDDICNLCDKLKEQSKLEGLKSSLSFSYYGIPFAIIVEIAREVSLGKNYSSMCIANGLNKEKQDMLLLIFARECYYQGQFEMGDYYLNQVMKSPWKNEEVNRILKEILDNRENYFQKDGQFHFRLVLQK